MIEVQEEDVEFMCETPKVEPAKEKSARNDSRAGQQMDVVSYYNIGRMSVRIIPEEVLHDGQRRLYRAVRFGVAGKVVDPTSDKGYKMNIQIPCPEDFKCKLTLGQHSLIQKLREQAKKFSDFVSYSNKDKYPQIAKLIDVKIIPQQVFAFGKLLKQKLDHGEVDPATIGAVRILKFTKGMVGQTDFATLFRSAIESKTELKKNKKWMLDYFVRKEGQYEHCLNIQISKGKQYNIALNLDECETFDLTSSDLEISTNLDTKVYNIETFDEAYFQKLEMAFARVEEKVNRLAKDSSSVEAPVVKSSGGVTKMEVETTSLKKEVASAPAPAPDFSTDSDEDFPF